MQQDPVGGPPLAAYGIKQAISQARKLCRAKLPRSTSALWSRYCELIGVGAHMLIEVGDLILA